MSTQAASGWFGISRQAYYQAQLRTHDLLVSVKRRASRTTDPGPCRCPNLLDGLTIHRVKQVWVVNITYLTTQQGFRYLALLTDAYARFIVGDDLPSSLAVDGSLHALHQAISPLPSSQLQGLIHHSDHDIQYSAWPILGRMPQYGPGRQLL